MQRSKFLLGIDSIGSKSADTNTDALKVGRYCWYQYRYRFIGTSLVSIRTEFLIYLIERVTLKGRWENEKTTVFKVEMYGQEQVEKFSAFPGTGIRITYDIWVTFQHNLFSLENSNNVSSQILSFTSLLRPTCQAWTHITS